MGNEVPVEAKLSSRSLLKSQDTSRQSRYSQRQKVNSPHSPNTHFGVSRKHKNVVKSQRDQHSDQGIQGLDKYPVKEMSISVSASSPSELDCLDIAEILAPPFKSDGGLMDILDVDYILDTVEQRERMMERLRMNLGPSLETISLGGDELSIISRHSTISLSHSALEDEHGILDNMTIDELIPANRGNESVEGVDRRAVGASNSNSTSNSSSNSSINLDAVLVTEYQHKAITVDL